MKIPNHGDVGIGCICATCPSHIYFGLVCAIHSFTKWQTISHALLMISFARGLQLNHSTLFSVHDVCVSELFWWVLMSSWVFPSRANRMVSMPYTLLLLTAILMWWSTSFHDLGSTGLTRTMQAEHVWTWLLEDEKRNMILEYLRQEGAVTMWSKAGSVQVPYNKYSDQTGQRFRPAWTHMVQQTCHTTAPYLIEHTHRHVHPPLAQEQEEVLPLTCWVILIMIMHTTLFTSVNTLKGAEWSRQLQGACAWGRIICTNLLHTICNPMSAWDCESQSVRL